MMGKNQNNLIDINCCWNCTNRRLLTLEEAAEACGASINTIYQWMRRGDIEWVYNAGGNRRIYWDSLVSRGLVARADVAPLAPEAA